MKIRKKRKNSNLKKKNQFKKLINRIKNLLIVEKTKEMKTQIITMTTINTSHNQNLNIDSHTMTQILIRKERKDLLGPIEINHSISKITITMMHQQTDILSSKITRLKVNQRKSFWLEAVEQLVAEKAMRNHKLEHSNKKINNSSSNSNNRNNNKRNKGESLNSLMVKEEI